MRNGAKRPWNGMTLPWLEVILTQLKACEIQCAFATGLASLSGFFGGELLALCGALIAVVSDKFLTGSINLEGLLADKFGAGDICPSRVPLLFFTLAAKRYYLLSVVGQARHGGRLPDVPDLVPAGNGFTERLPAQGGDEKAWTSADVRVRRTWLANHQSREVRASVYRGDCWQRQIQDGNLNLGLAPVVMNGTPV